MSLPTSETSPLVPKHESEESTETAGSIASQRSLLITLCEIAPAMMAVFCASVDFGVMMTSYESIGNDFGQLYDTNWLPVAYFFSAASTLPMYHAIQDRHGWTKCLLFALAAFIGGNFYTGLSKTMRGAVLGRALVGLGGGYMMSIGPSVAQGSAPKHLQGNYKVAFSASLTLGCTFGAPFGGLMAKFATWRWAFYCEGIAAYVLLILSFIGFYTCQPRVQRRRQTPLKLFASLLSLVSLLSLAALLDPSFSIPPAPRAFVILVLALPLLFRLSSIDRMSICALVCASLLGAGAYHISLFQQTVFLKPAHVAAMWLTPAIVGSFVGGYFKGGILWASALQLFGTIIALCHVGVVKKQLGGLVTGWVLTNIGSAGILSSLSQLSEDNTEPNPLELSESRVLGSFLGVVLGFAISKWSLSYHMFGEVPQYIQVGAQVQAYEAAVTTVMCCVMGVSGVFFGALAMERMHARKDN